LIDRLTQRGKVTDFISVGTFPVFNIADSAISIGTAALILGVWLSERAEKRARADSEEQGAGEQTVLSEK
jgi:signal peptidase II